MKRKKKSALSPSSRGSNSAHLMLHHRILSHPINVCLFYLLSFFSFFLSHIIIFKIISLFKFLLYPGKRSVCFKEVRMCVAENVCALIETWRPGIILIQTGVGVYGRISVVTLQNLPDPHIGLCIVFRTQSLLKRSGAFRVENRFLSKFAQGSTLV